MLVGACFPFAVLPRVVAELRRVFQLLLRDFGAEPSERGVVSESAPRDWIMAVAQSQKSSEVHDRIGHAAGYLVDDEVIDLTDVLAVGAEYLGSINVFTGNAPMIGMSGCTRHNLTS
jgi:hypothetical protein